MFGGLKESDVSLDKCSPCESLLLQVTENPTTVASGNSGFSDCIRILWRHPHVFLPVDTSVHTSQSSKGQNVQLFESFLQSRSSLCPWWGGDEKCCSIRAPTTPSRIKLRVPRGVIPNNSLFIAFLLFLVSCPISLVHISWDHLLNKLLAFCKATAA